MFKSWALLCFFVYIPEAFAFYTKGGLGARTYPQGSSASVSVAHDFLLWDQPPSPFFGVFRPEAHVAAHGELGGDLAFYPVSFLKLNTGISATDRYYVQQDFDCKDLVCGGWLFRRSMSATAIGGYSPVFLLLSWGQIDHSISDISKPVAIEGESVFLNPGGEKAQVNTRALIWKTSNSQSWILAQREFRAEDSTAWTRSWYLVFKNTVFDDYQLSLGGGQFESSRWSTSASFVFSIERTWGTPLSLF